MARIIGGIACSRTSTIGFAPDMASSDDPVTSLFCDHHSAFALGFGERFELAGEGAWRLVPPLRRAVERFRPDLLTIAELATLDPAREVVHHERPVQSPRACREAGPEHARVPEDTQRTPCRVFGIRRNTSARKPPHG